MLSLTTASIAYFTCQHCGKSTRPPDSWHHTPLKYRYWLGSAWLDGMCRYSDALFHPLGYATKASQANQIKKPTPMGLLLQGTDF